MLEDSLETTRHHAMALGKRDIIPCNKLRLSDKAMSLFESHITKSSLVFCVDYCAYLLQCMSQIFLVRLTL